jgi:pilus assembly protein FimV
MGMARETQGSPAGERKLEQYGVWVKVKPREVIQTAPLEESFELSDLESSRAATATETAPDAEGFLTAEEEQLLDDLETELNPGEEADNVFVPEEEPLLADGELPDIESATEKAEAPTIALGLESEEDLPELEEEQEAAPRGHAEAAEVEVTLSEDIEEKDHFGDLDALESELASVTTKHSDQSVSSAEILARIESELKSIRTDLTQLRGELSGLRASSAEPAAESPSAGSESPSGFFDDDEDETIALTGDELDNILNTADITEESAETPSVDLGLDLEIEPPSSGEKLSPDEDILSYETPVLDEDRLESVEIEEAAPESDDTLVLSEEPLLSAEELPADLELEELSVEKDDAEAEAVTEIPEIDLEGIPEVEAVPAPARPADDESETIDLETLDLGEEPTIIDAVPEQVDDAEELLDIESATDIELQDETAPGGAAVDLETIPEEVDLEALAAEAEELEDKAPAAPSIDDLEIGELESVADEEAPAAPEEEIEIAFESEPARETADGVDPLDQVLEMEEIGDEASAGEAPAGAPAAEADIPDNLKDEIRTVLKYMDHLLEALPDEKIQEFASSDYFVMYKKLFEDLGLGE